MAADHPRCSWFERLAAAADAGRVVKVRRTRSSTTTVPDPERQVALKDRGVSLGFLREVFGGASSAVGALTPGRLVHGRNTTGPPDDWLRWDPQADPLSIRTLTERTGLSLVETAMQAAASSASSAPRTPTGGGPAATEALDDPFDLLGDDNGFPFFGPATDFVSYTWHGITCGDLFAALVAEAESEDSGGPATSIGARYYWIDIFAVAQNHTPQHDLRFADVIEAVPRAVAVMDPWSNPRMLARCWCLYELEIIFRRVGLGLDVRVALLPAEIHRFRSAIKGNFGSLLMTLCACIDSKNARATRKVDQVRIFAEIEELGIGFDELNVRVLTLLNGWLREQHRAIGGDVWLQRPAREQVVDFMGRLEGTRQEVKALGLDPSVTHRASDGVLSIGGADGIIIGCTDLSAYISGPDPKSEAQAAATAGPATLAGAAVPVDDCAPPLLSAGHVVGEYSAILMQMSISSNVNKFYRLQVIKVGTIFYCWRRWGRVTENGAGHIDGPHGDQATAVATFEKQFKAKTGLKWADRYFGTPGVGKYIPVFGHQ